MRDQQLSLLPSEDRIARPPSWSDLPIEVREEVLERFAVLLLTRVRPHAFAQELTDEPIEDSGNPSST